MITPETNQVVTRPEPFTGALKLANEPAQSLAMRMRAVAGDPSYRLEGGAAAWHGSPALAAVR